MQRPSVRKLVSVIKLWNFCENLVTDSHTVVFHFGAYISVVKFVTMKVILFVFSGLSREVNETCALLGCYVASSDNSLLMFRTTYRSYLQGTIIFTLENKTDRLFQNVGKKLSLLAK
jgi:hypothetical protein